MTNEAAERLLHLEGFLTDAGLDFEDIPKALAIAGRALAAERKATVERIRAALIPAPGYMQGKITPAYVTVILDAEAER